MLKAMVKIFAENWKYFSDLINIPLKFTIKCVVINYSLFGGYISK
jgi:hypothetical protein